MKTTLKLFTVLMLALTVFGQAGIAHAGGGGSLNFRGPTALANFSSTDASGCIVTEASVLASDGVWQAEPGPGSALSFATVVVSQYDVCNQAQVLLAYGSASPLTEDAFRVTQQLNSAALQGTAYVFDEVSGGYFTLDVHMTWTGVGELTRSHAHDNFHSPGCVINSHSNDSTRAAHVTGSLTDGSTNFTPEPAYEGSIVMVMNGTKSVGCN